MNAERYDVSRLASLTVGFILACGVTVEDGIEALQTAERLLRQARDDRRAQPGRRQSATSQDEARDRLA